MRNLKEKRFLVLITTILALLASITSIHEISAYQAEENLIRAKFNPPFAYDYLHNLSISNPNRVMSANVWLVENEERTGMNTAQLKQYAMEILPKQHNAEMSYCPRILPFISIMATATEIVDLFDYLPDADGELKVRLYFTGIHLIDYVGLDTTKQDDFNLHHANLVSAIHSEEGSIKTELLESDDLYAELVPGQQIELAFTLPENSEDARTFITHVEGHYYTIG